MTLRVDPSTRGTGQVYIPQGFPSSFADAGYCGASFNDGHLRFHDSDSGPLYREHVREAFGAALPPDADVLAVDWMGRQIVTSASGAPDPVLYVADIGTGLVTEFLTLSEFTFALKRDHGAVAFDEQLYVAWKASVGIVDRVIAFDECVGYATPSFLGGADSVDNLEFGDLDVYWTIGSQIFQQVRDLPPGTPVTLSGGAERWRPLT